MTQRKKETSRQSADVENTTLKISRKSFYYRSFSYSIQNHKNVVDKLETLSKAMNERSCVPKDKH